jgi:signal transduction histidine kinase
MNFSSITDSSPLDDTSLAAEWGGLLYEISRQFASSLELEDVLGKVLSLTTQALEASRGSIFLLDEAGHITRSLLSRRDRPVEIKDHNLDGIMRDGLAGWVFSTQQADFIADTENDPRWHVIVGDTMISRSALAAPLMRHGNVTGVITLIHTSPNVFTTRHVRLLEVIATQAASAIENAKIYTDANLERIKLQAIIEGVQDVIFVTDQRQRLILANPAAQLELGISPATYGQPIADVLTDPVLRDFYQQPQPTNEKQQEVTLADRRIFNVSRVIIPNLGSVITLHDITTFKKLDELKSEFVAHVSHDLKAPLAIIQGYAWLLNHTPELSDEARNFASHILNSVDKMLELISNLLDLGRIEMGIESEFLNISLGEIACKAAENLLPLAETKKLSIEIEGQDESLLVYGSILRLEQAATNLIGNAIKFTPPTGKITIRLHRDGQLACMSVQDMGPGIPAEMRPRLFEKFSRLGQAKTLSQEGHGLGLAIVKSIVDAHKGKIWVESEVGRGSTFVIALPIVETA